MLSRIIDLLEQGKYEKIKSLLNNNTKAKELILLFQQHPDTIFAATISSAHLELISLIIKLLPHHSRYLRDTAGLLLSAAYEEVRDVSRHSDAIAYELMNAAVGYLLKIPKEEKSDSDYRDASIVLTDLACLTDHTYSRLLHLGSAIILRRAITDKTHKDHIAICSNIVCMLDLANNSSTINPNLIDIIIKTDSHGSIIYKKNNLRIWFVKSFQQITHITPDDFELRPEKTNDGKVTSIKILWHFYNTYNNAHPIQNDIYALAKYVFGSETEPKKDFYDCMHDLFTKAKSMKGTIYQAFIENDLLIFLELLNCALTLNCLPNKNFIHGIKHSLYNEAFERKTVDSTKTPLDTYSSLLNDTSTHQAARLENNIKHFHRYRSADNEIHCDTKYIAPNSRYFKQNSNSLTLNTAKLHSRKINKRKQPATSIHLSRASTR